MATIRPIRIVGLHCVLVRNAVVFGCDSLRPFPRGVHFSMVLFWTVLLLVLSNFFMLIAWYGHLKDLSEKPWFIAALFSWGIALIEYLIQVPANRLGYTQLSLGQLKILQEVITLAVFVPFVYFYMKQGLKWDYLWAGLCMCGAVYFIFRDNLHVSQPPQAP